MADYVASGTSITTYNYPIDVFSDYVIFSDGNYQYAVIGSGFAHEEGVFTFEGADIYRIGSSTGTSSNRGMVYYSDQSGTVTVQEPYYVRSSFEGYLSFPYQNMSNYMGYTVPIIITVFIAVAVTVDLCGSFIARWRRKKR